MTFQFDSLGAFFVMNGHGPYVWACYVIVFSVLAYLSISPVLSKRAFLKQQQKLNQLQKQTQQP